MKFSVEWNSKSWNFRCPFFQSNLKSSCHRLRFFGCQVLGVPVTASSPPRGDCLITPTADCFIYGTATRWKLPWKSLGLGAPLGCHRKWHEMTMIYLDYVAWCRRSTVSCWFATLFDLVRPCWTVAQVSLDAQASISWTNGEVWLKKWLPADFETWELRKHARNVAPQQRCQVFMDFEFQSFTVFEFDACTTATSFFCVANAMLADQKTSASVSWWCALLCDRYAYTTSKARCVR